MSQERNGSPPHWASTVTVNTPFCTRGENAWSRAPLDPFVPVLAHWQVGSGDRGSATRRPCFAAYSTSTGCMLAPAHGLSPHIQTGTISVNIRFGVQSESNAGIRASAVSGLIIGGVGPAILSEAPMHEPKANEMAISPNQQLVAACIRMLQLSC